MQRADREVSNGNDRISLGREGPWGIVTPYWSEGGGIVVGFDLAKRCAGIPA
jgi:hypothetical protein